jgi:hypothetical protein
MGKIYLSCRYTTEHGGESVIAHLDVIRIITCAEYSVKYK